jgi:lysophospholipase
MTRDRLLSIPEAVPPPGGAVRVLEAPDGISLRVAHWMPQAGSADRGTVLLLHGFTEYIEKYYETVGRLLDRGFAVVTYDHRGQGLSARLQPSEGSGGQRGYQTDFDDLVAEAVFVHEEIVEAQGLPRPHTLMAHSMGGNVALRVLQEYPRRFDRAVLSAPMMGFRGLPLWLIRAVAGLYVWLGRGDRYTWGSGDADLDNPVNRVTSDRERHARAMALWRHEPALVTHGITWRWLREAIRSMKRVARRESMARIEVPTLLASAGRDLVVSSRHQLEIAKHSAKVAVVILPDAMHEILQETDAIQADFWEQFDRFVAAG